VIEHRLREQRTLEKQLGLMHGSSTTKTIFLLHQLMQGYEITRRIYIWFSSRYQGQSCGERKHKVPTKYITFMKDMSNNVVTSVRAGGSERYFTNYDRTTYKGPSLSP
jgi:hypothetical protein